MLKVPIAIVGIITLLIATVSFCGSSTPTELTEVKKQMRYAIVGETTIGLAKGWTYAIVFVTQSEDGQVWTWAQPQITRVKHTYEDWAKYSPREGVFSSFAGGLLPEPGDNLEIIIFGWQLSIEPKKQEKHDWTDVDVIMTKS